MQIQSSTSALWQAPANVEALLVVTVTAVVTAALSLFTVQLSGVAEKAGEKVTE